MPIISLTDENVSGTPFFEQISNLTDQGVVQTLIDSTVPASKKRSIRRVIVVCNVHGRFDIEADGVVIGSGRTGSSNTQVVFPFVPAKTLDPAINYKVKFKSRPKTPNNANIEIYIQASDLDA